MYGSIIKLMIFIESLLYIVWASAPYCLPADLLPIEFDKALHSADTAAA